MLNAKKLEPLHALLHPVWIASLFVLAFNDHLLKASLYAGGVTGKLSDFTGLLIAPVLLAAVLQLRSKRGLYLSAILTGVVFGVINISAEAAALWDAAVSQIYPYHTTVDPTDLIALIAIPIGIWLFLPVMARDFPASSLRKMAQYGLVVAGGLASVATSPAPETWTPEIQAQISVLNRSNDLHVLRIRFLDPSIQLDCDRVANDPDAYLKDDAFGPSERWLLQSGQEIGLQGSADWNVRTSSGERDCFAALIQSDTAPDILVFWPNTLEFKSFRFDTDIPKDLEPDPQTIVLEADYSDVDPEEIKPWRFRPECEWANACTDAELAPAAEIPQGAQYSWRTQHETRLHWVRSNTPQGTSEPDELCQTPGDGEGLAWGEVLFTGGEITHFERGPDGCHRAEFTHQGSWIVCAPWESLSSLVPEDGVSVTVDFIPDSGDSFGFQGGYQALILDIERVTTQGEATYPTVYLTQGFRFPDAVGIDHDVVVRESCAPIAEACGQVSMPVDLRIGGELVEAGSMTHVGEGVFQRDLYLRRATYLPVATATCPEQPGQIPELTYEDVAYLEAVIVDL